MSFWLHGFFRLVGRLGTRKPVKPHQLYDLLLKLTVLSRSAIVVLSKFLVAFVCCLLVFWIFCWYRWFCHRTGSDLLLFLFRSYSELLSKFGAISFQEYVSKGITHPVSYGNLVYKIRRVKDKPNFISSGSKIVKRLRRRQYDPVIIERTIGLVLRPFTALYR